VREGLVCGRTPWASVTDFLLISTGVTVVSIYIYIYIYTYSRLCVVTVIYSILCAVGQEPTAGLKRDVLMKLVSKNSRGKIVSR